MSEQSAENAALDLDPAPKLGSAPCPNCNLFARVIVAGHHTYPDNDWSYTVDCKKCGRRSS